MGDGGVLSNVSEFWIRSSRWWLVLAGILLFAFFIGVVLPSEAQRAERISGGGPSPDTSFFYRADDLYVMADAYGESGRQAYIEARFTFDLAWPFAYGLFLLASTSAGLGVSLAKGRTMRLLNLIPIGAVVFDLLENGAASLVMVRFPNTTPLIASASGVFTAVKWTLVGGSFAVLLVVLVLLLIYLIRGRRPI